MMSYVWPTKLLTHYTLAHIETEQINSLLEPTGLYEKQISKVKAKVISLTYNISKIVLRLLVEYHT